jgi:pimeloyl-ACP methyl ester carboxylesterase
MAETETALATLDVPLQVIWGANDAWLPPEAAKRFLEAIPDSQVAIIPSGGHFLMDDCPHAVISELIAFLTGPDCPRETTANA